MRLFFASASPFVRKVMIVLAETGQMDDVKLEKVQTTPLSPDQGLSSANPMAKIPALERPNGATLYDSRVICEFLNARADATLYARGWESKILEATGDGIADAAVLMSYEKRLRPEGLVWDDWLQSQLTKIHSACSALNTRWMSHLQGPLDIGQISVACALDYVDFRHPNANWRRGNDDLANWLTEFAQRESMISSSPS